MEYSLPYIFVLCLFGICAYTFEHSNNKEERLCITSFSILVFFIFFAFRGYVYTDWTSYAYMLDNISWNDLFDFSINNKKTGFYEIGFTLLCLLCKSISSEYAFLIIVITTIDTVLFIRFLKQWNINNISFVFFLFITFEGINIMFNLIRNQISIFIFLNALIYIEKRKPIPYFLLCTLATSFHLSSIVFFPLYFFLHKKTNKWTFLCLSIAFFALYLCKISIVKNLIGLAGEGIIGSKASLYTDVLTNAREFSKSGTIEKLFMTLLIFFYYDELTKENKGRYIFINCLLIYFFFYHVFAEFYDLSARLAILFVFPYWIIWIDFTKMLYLENNKKVITSILFLYCFYITLNGYNEPIQEYDNLLFGGKTQQERLIILNRTFKEK